MLTMIAEKHPRSFEYPSQFAEAARVKYPALDMFRDRLNGEIACVSRADALPQNPNE